MDLAIQLLSFAAAGLGIIAATMSILCELLRRGQEGAQQTNRDIASLDIRAIRNVLRD